MFNEKRFCSKCGRILMYEGTVCGRCAMLKKLMISRIILGLGIVGLGFIFVMMFI